MSRCKACQAIMNDAELANTNEHTGEPEDLCFECLAHAYEAAEQDDEALWLEIDALIEEIESENACKPTD